LFLRPDFAAAAAVVVFVVGGGGGGGDAVEAARELNFAGSYFAASSR
jgi:NAD(P)H-hydrate repair Nnr-like enzyme with NAD(P)H-hydrate epimerase domain